MKKEDCLDFLEAENFSKKIEFKKEFFYKNTYKCYIYKFMGRDTEIFRKYLFSDFLLSLKERKISCQGLADFALKCLNFKTKYKWGQIMEYDKRENCYFTDCSGLIKSYFLELII